MRTFVVGDVHGQYELFKEVLKDIDLQNDRIIFLGDYCDWGDGGIKVIQEIMSLQEKNSNIVALLGNHDTMLLEPFIDHPSAWNEGKEGINSIGCNYYSNWVMSNGGAVTWDSLGDLDTHEQLKILRWLNSLPLYYDFSVNGENCTAAHAYPNKLDKDTPFRIKDDAVWSREARYRDEIPGYDKVFLGHNISSAFKDGKVVAKVVGNIYHLDCGAKTARWGRVPKGRLCRYCVDTSEFKYVSFSDHGVACEYS